MLIDTRHSKYAKVYFPDHRDVDWDGGLWKERFDTDADSTVPHILSMFENNDPAFHVVENFRIAAGLHEGKHQGTPFGDGDFYKWMEAATYIVAKRHDQELENKLDEYIELIGKCQQSDGYISTKQIIADREKKDGESARLGDINDFEVYNFGHLFTAACAYKRVTGKDSLIKIAQKAAKYLEKLYKGYLEAGEAQTEVCPSHYMGLVELFRVTGEEWYLETAKMAIAVRDLVPNGSNDNQDAIPLRQHRKIMGHGVRSTYLYAGCADLYAETGDEELETVLSSVWKNCVEQKIYINGGIGALYTGFSPYGMFPEFGTEKVTSVHQAFGYEYQLPNVTAYNETCASLGNIMWNLRMFASDPNPKYMDLIERTMLNLTLASVSMDGNKYFYENMLRRTKTLDFKVIWPRVRSGNINCFCCPPNMARTIAQSSEYAYMLSDEAIWTGMYGESHIDAKLSNGAVFTMRQQTEYPWDGQIRFTFEKVENDQPFTLKLRIPGWAESGSIQLNGKEIQKLTRKHSGTYQDVAVEKIAGSEVILVLDMPVRKTIAHTKVEEDNNKVAIERGPLVYCLESADTNAEDLGQIMIASDAQFGLEKDVILGQEVTVLTGDAKTFAENDWYDENALYQTMREEPLKEVHIRLIPYFAWDNRGMGEMNIWLPVIWK